MLGLAGWGPIGGQRRWGAGRHGRAQTTLACSVPYALEGLVRRELELAQAPLLGVSHGSVVTLRFALPQSQAAEWVAQLSESGRGQLVWLEGDSTP